MSWHWEDEEPLWRTAGLHRAPPDFSYEDEGIGGAGDLPSDLQIPGGPETWFPPSDLQIPGGPETWFPPSDLQIPGGPETWSPPSDLQIPGGPETTSIWGISHPYPPYNPMEDIPSEGYKPRFPYGGEYSMTEMPLEGVRDVPIGVGAVSGRTTYDLTPSQEDIRKRRRGPIAYRATQTEKALRREKHKEDVKGSKERFELLKKKAKIEKAEKELAILRAKYQERANYMKRFRERYSLMYDPMIRGYE
jgi:hypothetical protein